MPEEKEINSTASRRDYGDGFYEDDAGSSSRRGNAEDQIPDRKGKPKKKGKGKKIVAILLLILAVILILTGIYLIVVLSRVNYTHEYPDHSISEKDGIKLRSESGIVNIMLFGEDNHKDDENGRADSMILLTIDKNNRKLKQTSFMRDLYLYIPGEGYNKLNAAFSLGGAKLACETIEYNFGIRIDDYLIINFNSFTDIVDSLGGVDIELTREEIEYINWQSYRNKQVDTETEIDPDDYTYHTNDNGEEVSSVHINGRQALWYARDRDSAGSDFDRTKRQRIVIDTIFTKLKGAGPLKLLGTIYAASGYLTTDMGPLSLCGKGLDLVFALGYERSEHRIPESDNYYDVYNETGMALQIADEDLERQRLYEFVFEG